MNLSPPPPVSSFNFYTCLAPVYPITIKNKPLYCNNIKVLLNCSAWASFLTQSMHITPISTSLPFAKISTSLPFAKITKRLYRLAAF